MFVSTLCTSGCNKKNLSSGSSTVSCFSRNVCFSFVFFWKIPRHRSYRQTVHVEWSPPCVSCFRSGNLFCYRTYKYIINILFKGMSHYYCLTMRCMCLIQIGVCWFINYICTKMSTSCQICWWLTYDFIVYLSDHFRDFLWGFWLHDVIII